MIKNSDFCLKKVSFPEFLSAHFFSPIILPYFFNRKDEAQLPGGILGWVILEADAKARI